MAEAYPDLKANPNFMQLQAQLKELEDSIESARRYYNAVVRDLNTAIEQFPSNVIASQFKFAPPRFLRARGTGGRAQTGEGRLLTVTGS